MVSGRTASGGVVAGVMEEEGEAAAAAVVSCDCCGLEEECTGEYIGGVRACFGGRWLCGLCSEAVKYEAGRRRAGDVEGAVRAHTTFYRRIRRGGPAERVAEGMCQMLRTASGRRRMTSPSPSPPVDATGPRVAAVAAGERSPVHPSPSEREQEAAGFWLA